MDSATQSALTYVLGQAAEIWHYFDAEGEAFTAATALAYYQAMYDYWCDIGGHREAAHRVLCAMRPWRCDEIPGAEGIARSIVALLQQNYTPHRVEREPRDPALEPSGSCMQNLY
jgi:hypothetical protein